MNEVSEQNLCKLEMKEEQEIPDQDDRYPGTFFKIPGSPITDKTTWSLT